MRRMKMQMVQLTQVYKQEKQENQVLKGNKEKKHSSLNHFNGPSVYKKVVTNDLHLTEW